MKELDVNYHPGEEYRELFDIAVDSGKCTDTCIGIKNDGTFLYINEKLMNSGNAYRVDREFFSIDKDEFCHYMSIAESKGEIEKAIRNGRTIKEELNRLSR